VPVKKYSKLEELSIKITNWMGSTKSLVVHTILFVVIFGLYFFGIKFEQILLILTTIVSLEAIYLSLFIQMTVNRNTQALENVEEDIDEIQEGVEDLQEDVGEIEGDVDKLHENVAEISKDVDEISEDVDKIGEDVDQIQEDVEDMSEEPAAQKVAMTDLETTEALHKIQDQLGLIMKELENLKK
jgi:methyl-accepting chemotaxis protein